MCGRQSASRPVWKPDRCLSARPRCRPIRPARGPAASDSRGAAMCASTVPMYAKPGMNPSMKTRYIRDVCSRTASASLTAAKRRHLSKVWSELARVAHRYPHGGQVSVRLDASLPVRTSPLRHRTRSLVPPARRSRCAADRNGWRPTGTSARHRARPATAAAWMACASAMAVSLTTGSIRFVELDEQRGVAGRNDPKGVHASACRSF